MKLNEVFNNIIDWEYGEDTATTMEAEFALKGTRYVVMLSKQHDIRDQSQLDMWQLEFSAETDDDDWTAEITGKGGAFAVFATVVDIVFYMLQHRSDIKKLMFSADEPSRIKLYKRMIATLVAKGWKVETDTAGNYGYDHIASNAQVWILER